VALAFFLAFMIMLIRKNARMTTTRIISELGALASMAAPLARSVRGIGFCIQYGRSVFFLCAN
jgi:hypothetical protein